MFHHGVAPNWGDCHRTVRMLNTNLYLTGLDAVIVLEHPRVILFSLQADKALEATASLLASRRLSYQDLAMRRADSG